MYYAGVDLHKRHLTLSVLDAEGNVLREHRRLSTDGLFAVLAEFDKPVAVALSIPILDRQRLGVLFYSPSVLANCLGNRQRLFRGIDVVC